MTTVTVNGPGSRHLVDGDRGLPPPLSPARRPKGRRAPFWGRSFRKPAEGPRQSTVRRADVTLDLVQVTHEIVAIGAADVIDRLLQAVEDLVEGRLHREEIGLKAHRSQSRISFAGRSDPRYRDRRAEPTRPPRRRRPRRS